MSAPPKMTYRAKRTLDQPPSLLERYGEVNILTLFRFYMVKTDAANPHVKLPNFDFGPMVEAAAQMSEKIVRYSPPPFHQALY
jgi:hypothetical protein